MKKKYLNLSFTAMLHYRPVWEKHDINLEIRKDRIPEVGADSVRYR